MSPSSKCCRPRTVCGECVTWDSQYAAGRFGSEWFAAPRKQPIARRSPLVFGKTCSRWDSPSNLPGSRSYTFMTHVTPTCLGRRCSVRTSCCSAGFSVTARTTQWGVARIRQGNLYKSQRLGSWTAVSRTPRSGFGPFIDYSYHSSNSSAATIAAKRPPNHITNPAHTRIVVEPLIAARPGKYQHMLAKAK